MPIYILSKVDKGVCQGHGDYIDIIRALPWCGYFTKASEAIKKARLEYCDVIEILPASGLKEQEHYKTVYTYE